MNLGLFYDHLGRFRDELVFILGHPGKHSNDSFFLSSHDGLFKELPQEPPKEESRSSPNTPRHPKWTLELTYTFWKLWFIVASSFVQQQKLPFHVDLRDVVRGRRQCGSSSYIYIYIYIYIFTYCAPGLGIEAIQAAKALPRPLSYSHYVKPLML